MSTTNLVEDRSKSGPSVASTGQAASAESLQHQTQSLENLLARSVLGLISVLCLWGMMRTTFTEQILINLAE